MKAKLMALILAAGLGITGIAMTVQAQGTNTPDKCRHKTVHLYEEFVDATYHDGLRHLSTYEIGYKCVFCSKPVIIISTEAVRYEQHDYEQSYCENGTMQSTCAVCSDSYTF